MVDGPGNTVGVLDAAGEVAMVVSAPWAIDANGNPVQIGLHASNDAVVLDVDHKNASVAYPVLADPSYSDYGRLNGAEKSFCRWPSRWSICSTAFNDSSSALSEAQHLYPNSLHNGQGDAFRHCYWSALMTIHMGRQTAAGFGDRHEEVDDQPYIEYLMDQRNNAIGRDDVGQYVAKSWKASRACKSRADDGRLWWIKNGRLV